MLCAMCTTSQIFLPSKDALLSSRMLSVMQESTRVHGYEREAGEGRAQNCVESIIRMVVCLSRIALCVANRVEMHIIVNSGVRLQCGHYSVLLINVFVFIL